MSNQARATVDKMFAAFGAGDIEGMQATVSDDTQWIYYGTEDVPYTGEYNGKDGVAQFVMDIVSNVDVQAFEPQKFVTEGDTVVVLGREEQKIKKNGELLAQEWVQVYTVEDGLITKMEEFANTAHAAKLFSK